MNSRVDSVPATSLRSSPHARATIVVVERHACLRDIARQILERCGYRVLTAGSGQEAKRVIRHRTRIDLVLTEVAMPDVSDHELALWCQVNRPGTQVILMSDSPIYPCAPTMRTIEMPFIHIDALVRSVREALSIEPVTRVVGCAA